MAAFASLFQLGAGVCFALSIFKEPIGVSEERLRGKIRDRRLIVADRQSEAAQEKEEALLLTLSHLETAVAESAKPAGYAMAFVYLAWQSTSHCFCGVQLALMLR